MEIDVTGPGAFAVDVVGVSQYQRVLEGAADEGAVHIATLVLEDSNPGSAGARCDADRCRADRAACVV
jgi:hypothetical protein